MVSAQALRLYKERVCREIDRRQEELVDLATRIHQHPELRFQEQKASAWLCDFLRQGGFHIDKGICGLPTSFKATLYGGAGGPGVAILAEYDALEGLGHACGHNLIATAAVGAALALASLPERFPGRLIVLGTPGEEGGGGKVHLLEGGAFADADAAMMIHPGRENRVMMQSLCREGLEISFHGKAAHASSAPHQGINALDAVVLAYTALAALRQQLKPDVRIHGVITHGGDAPNIIPEFAQLKVFVRAADQGYMYDQVLPKVKACAEGAAQATGARLEIRSYVKPYISFRNNLPLAEAFAKNLMALGRQVSTAVPDALASTDMGNVSQVLPAVHPTIAHGERAATHTPEFARVAASVSGFRAMRDGAKALAMTALDLFYNEELMGRVKAEFAETKTLGQEAGA